MRVSEGGEFLEINYGVCTASDLLKLSEKGLPRRAIKQLEGILSLKPGEIAPILHVSPRTLARYKTEKINKKLDSAITERILRIAMVLARLNEVFEDPETRSYWLTTENRVLGGEAPIRLLRSNFGIDMVLDELVRIEHGILA